MVCMSIRPPHSGEIHTTDTSTKQAGAIRWRNAVLFLSILLHFLLASPALSAEPLRLSVSLTPLSLPIYVAESRGYFSDEGLPLTITDVIGGHRSLQQVLDGRADLATCSEAVVMFNSFLHRDFAVIATFVTSDDDEKLIVGSKSGITHPQQLAGKRIGTVVGAAAHYYLDTMLLLNGVDPKSVHLQDIQPETMAEALRQGELDALAIWEPYPFKILEAVPGASVLPKSGAYVETFNLIAHGKLRGTRDGDLTKLLRALDKAQNFIRTEPLKAQAILRERLHVDQAFIRWIWPRNNYRLSLAQSLLTTLEGEARWARQEGYVKSERAPNYLDFIYAKPLANANPAAVSIGE